MHGLLKSYCKASRTLLPDARWWIQTPTRFRLGHHRTPKWRLPSLIWIWKACNSACCLDRCISPLLCRSTCLRRTWILPNLLLSILQRCPWQQWHGRIQLSSGWHCLSRIHHPQGTARIASKSVLLCTWLFHLTRHLAKYFPFWRRTTFSFLPILPYSSGEFCTPVLRLLAPEQMPRQDWCVLCRKCYHATKGPHADANQGTSQPWNHQNSKAPCRESICHLSLLSARNVAITKPKWSLGTNPENLKIQAADHVCLNVECPQDGASNSPSSSTQEQSHQSFPNSSNLQFLNRDFINDFWYTDWCFYCSDLSRTRSKMPVKTQTPLWVAKPYQWSRILLFCWEQSICSCQRIWK